MFDYSEVKLRYLKILDSNIGACHHTSFVYSRDITKVVFSAGRILVFWQFFSDAFLHRKKRSHKYLWASIAFDSFWGLREYFVRSGDEFQLSPTGCSCIYFWLLAFYKHNTGLQCNAHSFPLSHSHVFYSQRNPLKEIFEVVSKAVMCCVIRTWQIRITSQLQTFLFVHFLAIFKSHLCSTRGHGKLPLFR